MTFTPAETRTEWHRAFRDGYELPLRQDLVDRMLSWAIKANGRFAWIRGFTKETADPVGL